MRAMLKLGLIAGYKETDIRVWKNTLRCFIKIISKTQTVSQVTDLIEIEFFIKFYNKVSI